MTNMQLHASFTQLMKVFSAPIQWTDAEVQNFTGQLIVKKYKKGEFLLQPPQVCEHLFFINSGFCKACIREEKGKTRIIYFSGENEFTTDMLSFSFCRPYAM
ncbi:MAG: cyclic nucleotide-binding domain-containing protein [Polyangiaceae bacterium]